MINSKKTCLLRQKDVTDSHLFKANPKTTGNTTGIVIEYYNFGRFLLKKSNTFENKLFHLEIIGIVLKLFFFLRDVFVFHHVFTCALGPRKCTVTGPLKISPKYE